MSRKVDYISEMVAETFGEGQGELLQFTRPESVEKSQLEMDFSPTQVSYDETRKCLILDLEGERFEIPSNFGALKSVDFASDKAHFYISVHRDPDSLLEVLSSATNKPLEGLEVYVGEAGLELDIRLSDAFQQVA